jgi:competence protein ComEC
MRSIPTRFRAYQLGSPGSSFSYFAGRHFTVLEGRLTDISRASLIREMELCGVETADTHHITSWDNDHCSSSELEELLYLIQPSRIELPGYPPHTYNGRTCLEIFNWFWTSRRSSNRPAALQEVTPAYIDGLGVAENLGFKNIFYHPRWIDADCANNNSTVKLFRSGSFNLLSLGDIQDCRISASLRRCRILCRETDVVILAHHGADNGFTNRPFLTRVEPSLAICSADYDNQYDHPGQEICTLLYEQNITLMTTKTGDVIVKSLGDHCARYRAINLMTNSTAISSQYDFQSKKARILSYNADTVRQLYAPRPSYPR